VQREAEGQVLGSVFGLAAAFVRTTMIVSVALAPFVNDLLSPGGAILATAALLLLVGALALAAVLRLSTRPLSRTQVRPTGRDLPLVAPDS